MASHFVVPGTIGPTTPLPVVITKNDTLCDGGHEPVAGEFTGKIVLVRRGHCTFYEKIANALAGNASAVVVSTTFHGEPFFEMGVDIGLPPLPIMSCLSNWAMF